MKDIKEIEKLKTAATDRLKYYKATKIARDNIRGSLKASNACCAKARASYESASISYLDAINAPED